MFGLLVLPMIGLWLWFSYWLAGQATSKILTPAIDSETKLFNNTGRFLLHSVLTIFIILLPFIDQLIAYPKWQQLCESTSDIHWAEGVDPNDYRSGELAARFGKGKMAIFPMLNARYYSYDVVELKTNRTIAIMPHNRFFRPSPMFEFPSAAGGTGAIFLRDCGTSIKSEKIVRFLEQYELKIIGYLDDENNLSLMRD